MRKIMYSFAGLIVFYVLAISSSVIKLSSIPTSLNSVLVKVAPKINSNYTNKVFCVLPNKLLDKSKISEIQNALANNQVQVVDIENAKQIYQEQMLKNNTNKTQIDYYIYVEESDQNNYYYQLIDARDFKVTFAIKIKELTYENLMIPFLGITHTIDLSFIKYFKTNSNNDYNNLVDSKNHDLLIKRSSEIIAEGKGKSFPDGSKNEQKYFNDQYAILLNSATLNLLARDFNSCQEALKIAEKIFSKTSSNLTSEVEYIRQLTNTASKLSAAIEDSVNSIKPKNEISKLSINISNACYDKDAGFDAVKKLMYSHVVTVLFLTKSNILDIYERDLIDNILKANTDVTQKVSGSSTGADYLLSVDKNSWVFGKPKKNTTQKEYNGTTTVIVKWDYNIDAQVMIKITRNKDAIIMGSSSLSFTRKGSENDLVDFNKALVFSMLFDDGKLKDFINKTIK